MSVDSIGDVMKHICIGIEFKYILISYKYANS